MKRFLYIIIIIGSTAFGQTTENINMIISSDGIAKRVSKANVVFNEISGSPYLNNDFNYGKIIDIKKIHYKRHFYDIKF